MLETTIAGSLPKPVWLARPGMLWAPWQLVGEALAEAKRDATLLALKEQEDSGIEIVTDGEQARQHFVHGFLEHIEGVDFGRQVTMGIRNNRYEAQVPTVTGPLRRKGSVHAFEAAIARAHTRRQLKFTLPGPMTIVDTIADAHYGDKVALAMAFAALLNEEARELAAIGVDVIQFDEPAFNVYQVSVECAGAKVPVELLGLLKGKDVLLGAVDVASERVETPEEVAATIEQASRFVPAERLYPCTNCGMAPMDRSLAIKKLGALSAGAAL